MRTSGKQLPLGVLTSLILVGCESFQPTFDANIDGGVDSADVVTSVD